MTSTLQLLNDALPFIREFMNKPTLLPCIWLVNPIEVNDGELTKRLSKGMRIRIEKNNIIAVSKEKPATHIIEKTFTTCYIGRYLIEVRSLKNNELSTFKFER